MHICHGASVRLDDLVVNVAGDLVVQKRRRPIFERFRVLDALPAIFKDGTKVRSASHALNSLAVPVNVIDSAQSESACKVYPKE